MRLERIALAFLALTSLCTLSRAVDLENVPVEALPSPGTEAVLPPSAGVDDDVFFIVDKQANELAVHSLRDPARVLKKYRAISGASQGDKEREGDRKTPEGIYFLEREIPKARLQSLHGSAAFELNYPNPFDRIHKHTGYGIWIHGVDNEGRMEKRFDTKGCVALGNRDVVELRRWVERKHMTPVIVVDHSAAGQPLGIEANDGPLARRINDWVAAWSSKNADAYLAFYDPAFYARQMNYEQWTRYKRRLARTYGSIDVKIRDLRIFRHGKYSVALFWQDYKSDRYGSQGWKRLYLVGEGAQARILSEEMRNEVDGSVPRAVGNRVLSSGGPAKP